MAEDIQGALARWVGGALGVPTEYGEFAPGPLPCAMVKVSPGDPLVRRYRSGGGVYRTAYEVYLKVHAPTQEGRIAGLELLRGLAARIQGGETPDGPARYCAHEVTNAPALYAQTGRDEAVYQLTARLEYVKTTDR